MDMDEVIAIMLLVIVIALAYAYSQPKQVVVKPITWQEIVIDARTKTFLLQMQ